MFHHWRLKQAHDAAVTALRDVDIHPVMHRYELEHWVQLATALRSVRVRDTLDEYLKPFPCPERESLRRFLSRHDSERGKQELLWHIRVSQPQKRSSPPYVKIALCALLISHTAFFVAGYLLK